MVTLMILALLGILYALVVIPLPFPLGFRLFLGLLITWPVLSLYGSIPLPSGLPDLHYHRGYVGLLLCMAVFSSVLSPRRFHSRVNAAARTRRLRPDLVANTPPRLVNGVAPESLAIAPALVSSESARDGMLLALPHQAPPASRAAGLPVAPPPQLVAFPWAVRGYVFFNFVAVLVGIITGGSGTEEIAGYLDATLIPVALYYLTKRLVTSRERLVWFLGAIILAAIIVCLTGLYERALDLTASAFPIAAHDNAGNTRYLDVPGGRASGVFGSPSVYGGVVAMGLLASLCCMVHAQKKRTKGLLAGIALLLAYGVLVTFTRSVWISVMLVMIFAQFYFGALWKVTMPLIVGCGLVGVLLWSGLQRTEVVQDRVMNEENVVGRVERFIWSGQRFLERPIFGRGPGALDRMMQREFTVDGFSTSHNTYMTMLVDNGSLAFACFLALVLGWFAKVKSVLRVSRQFEFERNAVVAMAGLIVIWLLCAMSLELRYYAYYSSLFWVAGAIIEQLSAIILPHTAPASARPAGPITRDKVLLRRRSSEMWQARGMQV